MKCLPSRVSGDVDVDVHHDLAPHVRLRNFFENGARIPRDGSKGVWSGLDLIPPRGRERVSANRNRLASNKCCSSIDSTSRSSATSASTSAPEKKWYSYRHDKGRVRRRRPWPKAEKAIKPRGEPHARRGRRHSGYADVSFYRRPTALAQVSRASRNKTGRK